MSSHRRLGVPVVEKNVSQILVYSWLGGGSLGRMVAGRCHCLLEVDSRGCLPVPAWAEWLSFVACNSCG